MHERTVQPSGLGHVRIAGEQLLLGNVRRFELKHGIDWRFGAEWFESALVDYEPASNWFNWAFTIVPRATGGNAIQEEAKPLRPPRTRL